MARSNENAGQTFLEMRDVLAASNGAAIGAISIAIVSAAIAAPVYLPVAGAVAGAAIGFGVHKFASDSGASRPPKYGSVGENDRNPANG